MPTRHDLERLVGWCDQEVSPGWLKAIGGVALGVHTVVPTDAASIALALMTGDIALREVPGISELPDQPVHFAGMLTGVRNPERQAQLAIRADGNRVVCTLSNPGISEAWSPSFEAEHVQDESGLIRIDWTFTASDPGTGSSGSTKPTQMLFQLVLWPALRKNIGTGDVGGLP
jgi:hypothetical protein